MKEERRLLRIGLGGSFKICQLTLHGRLGVLGVPGFAEKERPKCYKRRSGCRTCQQLGFSSRIPSNLKVVVMSRNFFIFCNGGAIQTGGGVIFDITLPRSHIPTSRMFPMHPKWGASQRGRRCLQNSYGKLAYIDWQRQLAMCSQQPF